jgi:uncharacterized hydrophobic protein (TIGR00341 family)
MALRLLDVILPEGDLDKLKGVFRTDSCRGGPWRYGIEGGRKVVRVLIEAEESARLVDAIEQRCSGTPGFHLIIQSVEAALPRPTEVTPPKPKQKAGRRRSAFGPMSRGLSREELLTDAMDMSRPTRIFYITVVLSTIVAAVGLLNNNVAAIVGAMVIAPLLGPNIGLALATTLAEGPLFRQAVRSTVTGLGVALALTIPLGAILQVGVGIPEIDARTHVSVGDPILALAAGAAGTLAITTGVPMALVGVMVAVALLPPTAVLGLMLGTGNMDGAAGAGLLLATNVVCVILAGAVTFQAQGVRPGTWWQDERAARSRRIALVVLVGLLIAAVALIVLGESR